MLAGGDSIPRSVSFSRSNARERSNTTDNRLPRAFYLAFTTVPRKSLSAVSPDDVPINLCKTRRTRTRPSAAFRAPQVPTAPAIFYVPIAGASSGSRLLHEKHALLDASALDALTRSFSKPAILLLFFRCNAIARREPRSRHSRRLVRLVGDRSLHWRASSLFTSRCETISLESAFVLSAHPAIGLPRLIKLDPFPGTRAISRC